jgi:hypothetical protein
VDALEAVAGVGGGAPRHLSAARPRGVGGRGGRLARGAASHEAKSKRNSGAIANAIRT